jgi:tripartite-type tricarboxylate transporter receptor subunit TctC
MKSVSRLVLLLLLLVATMAQPAKSADWPSQTIRIIVPLPPGGAYDFVARLMADRLRPVLNVPIIVENKSGAGARIGTEYVARSPADGYTFLMIASTHVITPSIVRNLPYDAIRDFEPISIIAETPIVLAVGETVPAQSAKELIELARAKPNLISFGSTGIGSPFHLAGELLKVMAKIDIVHVPYRGTAPLSIGLLNGEVQMAFVPIAPYLQHFAIGKLRPLALGGQTRSSQLPNVPPLSEAAGLPGFGLDAWIGMVARAGTPKAIVERMNSEIGKILADQQVRILLVDQGYEPVGSSPAQMAKVMEDGLSLYARIVKDANIEPQ